MKIAVLIHAFYYVETLNLIESISWIHERKVSVLLTVSETLTEQEVTAIAERLKLLSVKVKRVKNIGFDLAGLTTHFNKELSAYDLVLKIHSKRSSHNTELIDWMPHIHASILSSSRAAEIIDLFEQNAKLGVIGPSPFHAIRKSLDWGGNFYLATKIAELALITLEEKSLKYFPAGTMFWFRPQALSSLLSQNISEAKYYATEVGGKYHRLNDGTLAHAIERLIGIFAEYHGFMIGFYRTPEEVKNIIQQIPEDYADLNFYSKIRSRSFRDKQEALEDYLKIGESLSMNLNRFFNVQDYLNLNKDIDQFITPPLLHYHNFGMNEGRSFNKDINIKECIGLNPISEDAKNLVLQLISLESKGGVIAKKSEIGYPLSVKALTSKFKTSGITLQNNKARLVKRVLQAITAESIPRSVALAHRDPFTSTGGADNFLTEQLKKIDPYLVIWPSVNASLIMDGSIGIYSVRLSGEDTTYEVSFNEVRDLILSLNIRRLFINHIIGFNYSLLMILLKKTSEQIVLYLHDFYLACPQTHLMFNGIEGCGSLSLDAQVCNYCLYGVGRKWNAVYVDKLLLEMNSQSSEKKVELIANSEFTKAVLVKLVPNFISKISVIEPVRLKKIETTRRFLKDSSAEKTVNVRGVLCFAGLPVRHKGYEDFIRLSQVLSDKYDFVVVSSDPAPSFPSSKNVCWKQLAPKEVLRDGLLRVNPDVVLVLSKGYESYSIATAEAISLGLTVFAYSQSGNIPFLINYHNSGIVFDSYQSLEDYLSKADNFKFKSIRTKYEISMSEIF
jgi:hypothetical protein